MSVSASGSGERELMVSYISEFQCGRALTELFARTPGNLLQGWAIVDKQCEDWKTSNSRWFRHATVLLQNISQPITRDGRGSLRNR